MSDKDRLLDTMRAARADLEAVVRSYEGRLDAELGDGWRVRDALAHLAVWERVAVRKIAGTPLPNGEELAAREPWDLDAFNEAMRERWRTRTADEVLAEFAAAHRTLVATIEGAGEADCAPDGIAWRAVAEDGAGHYPAHFPVANPLAAQAAPPATGP